MKKGEFMKSKIVKGDAYELIKEIQDKSIDLIITDPPYDIGTSHGSGIFKTQEPKYLIEIENAEINNGFDLKLLDELCRVLKKINIYIFCNKTQIYEYLKYFVEKKQCNWELLIWEKDNPPPLCGTHYLIDKEYCLYFWETGAPLYVTYDRGKTIYRSKTNKDDKEIYKHPTCKPITFVEQMILNSSERGGVILDPFLGSGTTARAAKNLGREYIGFEINDKYYKIAQDRLSGINAKGGLNLFELDEE